MESIANISFYQLGGKTKKKKKNADCLLSQYNVCVKDMVEGDMKREVAEIPLTFDSGLFFFVFFCLFVCLFVS